MTFVKSPSLWIALGATSAMIAVLLGAFAAHGLKPILSTDEMAIFQTATQYAFYHALGLLALGLWSKHHPSARTRWIGFCFAVGTLLFSGSLYALTFTGIKTFGMITPLGGTLFIVGWFLFALDAVKSR